MTPSHSLRGKRILLVEDDAQVREAFRLLLNLDEHQVTEAENGRDACHRFTPGDFDLVITDYAMPEMKGDELAKTIKTLCPRQPVLMATSHTQRRCGPENPVDAVLLKPFTMEELRDAISRLLAQPSGPLPASRAVTPGTSPAPATPPGAKLA
jgi:CheY-like chemotaxis protein